uniref:FACT complex subunit SSRP1 n=3 Tax=Lepeophtheirus salmonis TaxID=72036 RepID=A0A0K2SX54_LEPSM
METIPMESIELVNWQRMAGGWGIRLFDKDGNLHRFAGFKDGERERLANFFSQTCKKDMLNRELSVKGWNWGTVNFDGSVLGFEVGGKGDAFEIPLQYVNQCITGRNEVTLEFNLNEDAAVNLSELRFHIPTSENAGEDAIENFKEQVMKNASVVDSSGSAIAILQNVHCLSPRGRYDVKIYNTFLHLHGKTFDYKISMTTITRMFLLPHKDQRQRYFVVKLDPPIKQGQTRYHYLVLNFHEDEEEEVELPFTEEELKDRFDGKLPKEVKGLTYEVLGTILKALINKKITMPGSFLGHSGTPVISCSHRAVSGFIYPLERGFMFVYKPPIFLRYDEVRGVTFERSGGSTRSFDVSVNLKNNDIVYTFSSIEKGEYQKLYDYLKSKNLNLKVSGKTNKSGIDWGDDRKVDHHLHNVIASANELSSELSSDDTDFNPDALEALSAKEEYDSEPSTTSTEESDVEGTGPEADAKREEKRKKKELRRVEKESEKSKKPVSSKKKEGGGSSGQRKKKTKLPGQPKRNQSAYFLWMNENREKIKSDFPGLSITEFGKKAGELWKDLKDKTDWDAKAAEDKKRYDEDMRKWKSSSTYQEATSKSKSSKSSSSSSKKSPKKPAISVPQTGSFKSKEFIEDSTDSSDNDNRKKKKKSKDGKNVSKSSSDEEMKSENSD